VRHSIRSYTFLDDPPSTVMTRVNNAIHRDILSENDMLTAFLAILDTRDGTLAYASAGHEPPVLRRSDGSVEYLSVRGPMFTGLSEPVYPEGRATLEMGDLLVMFTDGITEARNSHDWELFGIEGVERRLSENADVSAEQFASGLLEDAVNYAHGALRDDVAIVVIKRVVSIEEP
ncbi:MAG: PP2C family protein-serine/threonine phosphatase, partial [Armatimonadota bacterium]